MCGICGIFSWGPPVAPHSVEAMNRTIKHRGPDDEGYLIADTEKGVFIEAGGEDTVPSLKGKLHNVSAHDIRPNLVFGHRRLSIIDLSDRGHQPMKGNGCWIVYNGEIYNFPELRKELSSLGYRFNTQTDTEVILAAYDAWGEDCLERFNGMWAFALWDRKNRKLFCARDRFGIKPLYFTTGNSAFLFGSEIKAILAAGDIDVRPNERCIYDFLANGWVDHTPETFFLSVRRLGAGSCLTVNEKGDIRERRWWRLERKTAVSDPVESFRALFEDAVNIRLRSDVPVGSCLSGGLDSSYVVSQMARLTKTVYTFSAVYGKGVPGDESPFIDAVVRKSGAVKHTVTPDPEALLDDMEKLVYHQEEPFGSTSIFAQWKVMALAKKHGVTVLLDGQGADEYLGGYLELLGLYYTYLFKTFRWASLAKEGLGSLKRRRSAKPFKLFAYYSLPNAMQQELKVRLLPFPKTFARKYTRPFITEYPDDFNDIFALFLRNNLPQLLRFEDRNSMAFSRETRLPFLDYRLVEMVHSLPTSAKIDRGVTKRILRKAMEGLVPDVITNRHDKVGFETPEADWFRHGLSQFLQQTLSSRTFLSRPYWNAADAAKLFQKMLRGRADCNILWRMLSVELWFKTFIDSR